MPRIMHTPDRHGTGTGKVGHAPWSSPFQRVVGSIRTCHRREPASARTQAPVGEVAGRAAVVFAGK
jgi:hypothetical protein